MSESSLVPVSGDPALHSRGSHRACRSPRAWMILLMVLGAGLSVDLVSKAWAFWGIPLTRETGFGDGPMRLPFQPPAELLPGGLLDMQLVVNHGAVFGIGANQRFFFIVFTIAALTVGLLVFGRMTRAGHRLAHIAIGMILAGGIGNLYDRIVYGFVRDFLHAFPRLRLPFDWRWPGGSPELFPWVFNVADMLLLTGMALLMIHMTRQDRHRKVSAAAATIQSN